MEEMEALSCRNLGDRLLEDNGSPILWLYLFVWVNNVLINLSVKIVLYIKIVYNI